MKLPDWLVKIAEFIFKGRQAGLFNENERQGKLNLDMPAQPENVKGIKK